MKKFAVLFLSLACSINAETLYVSTEGNDSFSGTKVEPLRSIARAVMIANSGDTILLEQGRYREEIRLSKKGSKCVKNVSNIALSLSTVYPFP